MLIWWTHVISPSRQRMKKSFFTSVYFIQMSEWNSAKKWQSNMLLPTRKVKCKELIFGAETTAVAAAGIALSPVNILCTACSSFVVHYCPGQASGTFVLCGIKGGGWANSTLLPTDPEMGIRGCFSFQIGGNLGVACTLCNKMVVCSFQSVTQSINNWLFIVQCNWQQTKSPDLFYLSVWWMLQVNVTWVDQSAADWLRGPGLVVTPSPVAGKYSSVCHK